MYDELINKLRIGAKCFPGYELYGYAKEPFRLMPEHLTQAADAIEGLSHAVDQMTEWRKHLWIPVTEQLPENGQKVLAFKTLDTKPPVPWYLILSYSTNLESVSEYEFQNETHGGFYEYDDGYYERTGITHWMQLPKPPEDK